jgi:predicted porin
MTVLADTTIYGKAIVSYDGIDFDNGGDRLYKVTSNTRLAGAPRSSRLGFKGSEDLGGGLKAIWKMEFSVDQADNAAVGSTRNAYVGLAGNFGTAVLGRHDTPYKMSVGSYDLFADQLGDFNGTVGFDDNRAPDVVAYISPDFSGLNVAAAIVTPGTDELAEGYSIGATYNNAGLKVSLSYEDLGDVLAPALGDAEEKWGVAASYSMGAFSVMGRYEDGSDVASVDGADYDAWQVGGSFGFGNNAIKAMYGSNDPDGASATDTWAVGLDHNFSKRSTAFVQWVDVEDSWDGFSLGMSHKF